MSPTSLITIQSCFWHLYNFKTELSYRKIIARASLYNHDSEVVMTCLDSPMEQIWKSYSLPQALLSTHLKTNLWNLNDAGLFKSPPIIPESTDQVRFETWAENANLTTKSHNHFLLLRVKGTHKEMCLK